MDPRFIAAQMRQRGISVPPDPPSITSVTPDTTGISDAEPLVIAGTGFTGATDVTAHFADDGHGDPVDLPVSGFTVVRDIEIDCDGTDFAPAVPGVNYITVTGPGGSDTIPFTTT